jgi:hypothetical protein
MATLKQSRGALMGSAVVSVTTTGRSQTSDSTSEMLAFAAIDPDTGQTPGAVSNYRLASSAATTNATVVKNAAGKVYSGSLYNSNAAARYLKFYNKATAPTVGTDVPVWVEYLPPTSKTSFDLNGVPFSAGISVAIVTGAADNDATAVGAGDIQSLNIGYA